MQKDCGMKGVILFFVAICIVVTARASDDVVFRVVTSNSTNVADVRAAKKAGKCKNKVNQYLSVTTSVENGLVKNVTSECDDEMDEPEEAAAIPTAGDLFAEYFENPFAFNRRYNAREIQVDGAVTFIDAAGQGVEITAGINQTIHCSETDEKEILKLKKYHQVRTTGRYSPSAEIKLQNIDLTHCRFDIVKNK